MPETGAWPFIHAVNEFIFVSHPPEKSDMIFIPGSSHPEHVLEGARLYREGYAPFVLPSGWHGFGKTAFTLRPGYDTEWAWMRSVLLGAGVPDSAILREDRATFTWENAQLSRRVTDELGLKITRALLCCKDFHARRALMYYQAAFPEAELLVCPVHTAGCSREDWWRTEKGRARVLGEVRRLGDQVNDVFAAQVREMTGEETDE